MKNKYKTIIFAILITFICNYLVLSILPKLIASIFMIQKTITSRYIIGIIVRMIGIIITTYLIKKFKIKFNNKFKTNYLLVSWLFIIYIIFNIELIPINSNMYLNVFLMIIDAISVGIYEELLFRGFILNILIKSFKSSNILIPTLISSILFGLIHFMNLTNGIPFSLVLYQVVYATIIGFSFSALYIKNEYNIIICIILHILYDVASGLTDLLPNDKLVGINISTFIGGILPFIPLLIYSLFLLKNKTSGKN